MYDSGFKDKIDILEVVSSFLPLKRIGASYKCCCPFHHERTPSFVVTPSKNIFYCFGCGVGGDAIKFIQKYKNLGFREALELVGDICGFSIENDKYVPNAFQKHSLELLKMVNGVFKAELLKDVPLYNKIREYLFARGLKESDFDKYHIGVCPSAEIILENIGDTRLKLAQETGILKSNEATLTGRITFGICDISGNIIGFAGRKHDFGTFSGGKYINTKNSRIYSKHKTLYGLKEAMSSVRAGKIVIVEGYMDVIMAHKIGRNDVVAVCGTGFSEAHLARIIKINTLTSICFCFDNDEAGKNATMRALEVCFKHNHFNVFAGSIPKGYKDIAELVAKGAKLEITAISGFGFYVKNSIQSATTSKERDIIIKSLRNMVLAQDICTRGFLAKQMAKILGVSIKDIVGNMPISEKHISQVSQDKKKSQQAKSVPLLETKLLKNIFGTILVSNEFTKMAKTFLKPSDLGCYSTSYEKYINTHERDNLADEVFIKREFMPYMHPDMFLEALKQLKYENIDKSIQSCIEAKDTDSIIALQQQKKLVSLWKID